MSAMMWERPEWDRLSDAEACAIYQGAGWPVRRGDDGTVLLELGTGWAALVAEHEGFDALARPAWRWWCSKSSARRAIPGQPTYSLQPLMSALGLRTERAHRAMGDVLATAALLHACALRAGRWSVWAGPALAVWDEREAGRGLFGAVGGAA